MTASVYMKRSCRLMFHLCPCMGVSFPGLLNPVLVLQAKNTGMRRSGNEAMSGKCHGQCSYCSATTDLREVV